MNRELLIGLVIGAMIGWLVEWIIDWVYWRKKFNFLQKECADELILITGIGPVIEERLNKAGIYTFEQLAAKSEAEIRAVIGQAKNLADEKEIITQAKKFVREKAARKQRSRS